MANWKMHPQTLKAAKALLAATKKTLNGARSLSVIVAPPDVFLHEFAKGAKNSHVSYAAQNAHFEKEGAYTGDISMGQMKDSGASYVLIGHAERRALGETNEDTRKKVASAIALGLKPILCVGESARDDEGAYLQGFSDQVMTGLADVPKNKLKMVTIAYEPVWAIGAKEAMSPNAMHEMSLYIRKLLIEPFGRVALSIPILYGGAVDEGNAAMMLTEGEVQGLLVGRVSTDVARFSSLLKVIKARV